LLPLPLLPIDLLRIPIFALSLLTCACSFAAQMLALVSLPFHLHALGYSAVAIGLLITPWPLAIAFVAPISGRLSDRYPAGLLGLLGLMAFGAGLAALALLPARVAALDIVWRMALAGAGFGLYQSPNNRTMQAAAPRARSGAASGLIAMTRLLGQTIGAAMAALLFRRLAGDARSRRSGSVSSSPSRRRRQRDPLDRHAATKSNEHLDVLSGRDRRTPRRRSLPRARRRCGDAATNGRPDRPRARRR